MIEEKDVELQMIEAFKEGYEEFKAGDSLFAAKKFNEAELLFPQSQWAPKAALMAAYVYYAQDYFMHAESELKRFIRTYPKDENQIMLIFYSQCVIMKKLWMKKI